MLNAYAKAGNPTAAQRVFRRMISDGVQPNIYSYNILIQAWASNKRGREGAELVEAFLETIAKDENVQPDEVTYTTILNTWAKASWNFLQCSAIFIKMY